MDIPKITIFDIESLRCENLRTLRFCLLPLCLLLFAGLCVAERAQDPGLSGVNVED